ncbi:MAG: aerobic carbon-monoxide dehydrogenase medium subunit [Methylobacteriaceae bacterium]|nr:aerobic carbon-monoxide dehydrogenase medium subunit [Methylobacteriaceae bacterium]
MKPAPFLYHDPQSRADLHDLLARLENTKLLAGGQSLMPMLNMRIVAPDHVIDLNKMPGMTGVTVTNDHVRIGAMTRQADLHRCGEIGRHLPVMLEALDHVGHFQTRSRGTIGGSCCHLDPAAELPALCALYDAEFEVSGPSGARIVAARDWFQGYLQSALAENEVLESIRLPLWPAGTTYGFSEYARRHGDFALAGAAALIAWRPDATIARAAIVLFGVAAQPVRLDGVEQSLVGERIDADAIGAAIDAAKRTDAMRDPYVSAEYRQRLAGIMIGRALKRAAERVELAA